MKQTQLSWPGAARLARFCLIPPVRQSRTGRGPPIQPPPPTECGDAALGAESKTWRAKRAGRAVKKSYWRARRACWMGGSSAAHDTVGKEARASVLPKHWDAAIVFALAVMANGPAVAADSTPYFASIKSDKIYMRVGPGEDYEIKWVYRRKGLPVEVLGSYDAWRRVKDMDGETGWIHTALLSRQRTAIVIGENLATVTRRDEAGSQVVAKARPGTVGMLRHCEARACEVKFDGAEGWVPKARLWGVGDGEKF